MIITSKDEAKEIILSVINKCQDSGQQMDSVGFYHSIDNEKLADELVKAGATFEKHGEWLMPLTNEPWREGFCGRCSVCHGINIKSTVDVPEICPKCGTTMKLSQESST